MKVALIRNLHEEQNISMKLMADRLEGALQSHVEFENVRPGWPVSARPDGVWEKATGYYSRFVRYPRSAARVKADVYHVIDHAYAHVSKNLPHERTICNCHDLMLLKAAQGDFGQRHTPKVATALLRYSASFLREAGTVLANSQATKRDVTEMVGVDPEKVRVIHPPLDPQYRPLPNDLDRAALRRQLRLPDRPVLLHLGGNWFYKNVEGLLRAFAIVREESGLDPVLIKAGAKMSGEQRRLAAERGVLDHIGDLGVLGEDDVRKYYWASDALVFPSLWEGFGWPPVEAMACGLPVVCSRTGALAEGPGDAAEFVDPYSPEDIARGIMRVLEDSAYRAELVRRGFANVRRFDSAKYAEQMLDLYRDVAGERRSQRVCAE